MFRTLPTLLLALAGSTSVGALVFQQDRPGQQPGARPGQEEPGFAQGRGARAESEKNRVLATWLLAHDKCGMEIARFAQQRAQDPQVKQFAQELATQLDQFSQKLKPFGSSVAIGGPGAGGQQDPGRPVEAGAGRTGAPGQMDFDHVALVEELGAQKLQTAKTELEKKQGDKFDKAFVWMALGGLLEAEDMLTVFEKHATGELASTFNEGEQMVQRQIQQARQLAQTMDQMK